MPSAMEFLVKHGYGVTQTEPCGSDCFRNGRYSRKVPFSGVQHARSDSPRTAQTVQRLHLLSRAIRHRRRADAHRHPLSRPRRSV
jgi:hypothetical protein